MKRNYIVTLIITVSVLLNACGQKNEAIEERVRLTLPSVDAVGPYLSHDNEGNPVLCWSEMEEVDSLYRLKYAVYNRDAHRFNDPIVVPGTEGISLSAESMGKVMFKEDGAVVAVFSRLFKGESNKYAGAIYYCISEDGGNNWSKPLYLHSDTSHAHSRSFFDIAQLADGEIGAVWLDGRFAEEEEGSALFFAQTESGKGFGPDKCLDRSTCECCRTEILSENGRIHIAYRGIQFPSGKLGKQVRDMVYSTSNDNGQTFTPPRSISKDNWEIEGCPHTGPTMAIAQGAVNAIWFTGSGVPGLYFSSLKKSDSSFSKRVLISKSGRHPQLINVKNKLAAVWEESLMTVSDKQDKHQDHGSMEMGQHVMPVSSKVLLTIADSEGQIDKTIPISGDEQVADHAVITSSEKGALVAWVQNENGHSGIYYSFKTID